MESGLVMMLWYGILHAFGPDHLSAIADFSIGKERKKTLLITVMFALGHGVMLLIFARILSSYALPEWVSRYGDVMAAAVIVGMGAYLLFMALTDRIQLHRHIHEGKSHTHIWFGKNHFHSNNSATFSAFTVGAMMGIGGVRGMLVTLGMLEAKSIDGGMVLAFVAGVMTVFVGFGLIVAVVNANLLGSKQNVRRIVAVTGAVSVAAGVHLLV